MERKVYAVIQQCGDEKSAKESIIGIYAELSAANADAIHSMKTVGRNSTVVDKRMNLFWHNVRPKDFTKYYVMYYVQAYRVHTKSKRG